jgi:hypothetical protein
VLLAKGLDQSIIEARRTGGDAMDERTQNLLSLIERRERSAREAETVADRLEVLHLHRLIEDEHDEFFGPQVRDALRAGASWAPVRTATEEDPVRIALARGACRGGGAHRTRPSGRRRRTF